MLTPGVSTGTINAIQAAVIRGKVLARDGSALTGVTIDEALLQPGEGEVLADLLIAAHADAKRKLDAAQTEAMKAIAGPLGGLPGFPGLS